MNREENPATIFCYIFINSISCIVWLIFLTLKLNSLIDFNWFWVWFPLWIVPTLESFFITVAVVVFLIKDNYRDRKTKGLK
jgi:hypothetical protein